VVTATTGGPCRQRWLMRSASWSCEASAPKARGFARRPALDNNMREPAATTRQGRGADGAASGRDGHNGRQRLGIDMAGSEGEQIDADMRDGSGGGSGAAAGDS
jgi:hypothetical protein